MNLNQQKQTELASLARKFNQALAQIKLDDSQLTDSKAQAEQLLSEVFKTKTCN